MRNLSDFKEQQLEHSRVRSAYDEKESIVKELLVANNVNSTYELFVRAFKKEQALEIWVKEKQWDKFSLLITYPFCTTSGKLGPKRKEGDLQIPEGLYKINHFNPYSTFHLSLGINYPNASDKILSDKDHPGGAIYIHGNCVSIGCIPITDDKIKELYILAVESKNNGQKNIPVHIFPARLNNPEELVANNDISLLPFWNNLKTIYDDFEKTKKLKPVSVNASGLYTI